MFQTLKKSTIALVLMLVVFATIAGQGSGNAFAAEQAQGTPAALLAPGMAWKDLGSTTRSIQLNIKGDALELPGDTYLAAVRSNEVIPQDVVDYYSNEQLYKDGWTSDHAFEDANGLHKVFYHESDTYLVIDFGKCTDQAETQCVTVWKSAQANTGKLIPASDARPIDPAATNTFEKVSPSNNAQNITNLNAVLLDWNSYSPTPDKYSYCIKETTECADNDPNWTGTYLNTSITLALSPGKTYKWQVKAITCSSCSPKVFVEANSGAWWNFTTATINITGTVKDGAAIGVAGVTMTYKVSGVDKTVLTDANGNYTITNLPYNWSGTVTPSKECTAFTPASYTYTNLVINKTSQNFTTSTLRPVISGNTSVPGVTLEYADGGPLLYTTSDGITANYSLSVTCGWSGDVTVVPSSVMAGYSLLPAKYTYASIKTNQPNQNFTINAKPAGLMVDTIGVFRPSNGALYLRNTNTTGFADLHLTFGLAGDYPVTGDWDGDGIDSIGIYRNGTFYLRNANTNGFADITAVFGTAVFKTAQPVVGDWDGDGIDTIGVYMNGTFYLRNTNTSGEPELSVTLGVAGDVGIAGDWTGDGKDDLGVFRPSNGALYLKKTLVTGFADAILTYGLPGDKPVAGDWNGDGFDSIGVLRGNTFYLRNSNTLGFADITASLGMPGDMPLAGDWNGSNPP